MSARATWDVFCGVVDNYGDVGIAWRLARQLSSTGRVVRLFVDDLASFARIEPRVDAATSTQEVDGIEVRVAPDEDTEPASVVVEVLGCGLPARYLDAMVEASPAPVWIDFEHLSAESWVEGFHGLPSPHPRLPLTKHFFYPGFGDRTGGLLVEPGIDARRLAFVEDAVAIEAFRRRLGVPAAMRYATLFAYPRAAVAGLLDAFAGDGSTWSVVVPDGILASPIDAWFAERGVPGSPRRRGSLVLTTIPFVDQDDFDRLLWTSDANFVRGEDSFVRAQIAGRPFVWNIYPQPDDVHRKKLAAFVTLYTAQAGSPGDLWTVWNDPGGEVGTTAVDWLRDLPRLDAGAQRWQAALLASEPLIDRLVAFASERAAVS